jgi:fucose permease
MENGAHSSPNRLFIASCVALVVTSMSFAVRGDIMGALEGQFELTHEQSGQIAGTAFWGFTVAMVFGGPLCDWLGMGKLLILAFVGHLAGIAVTIFAGGYSGLFAGTLAIGIANGLVEAACNPLVATLYPNDKTHKLNQFHVWFPGGIVIGGLLAFALTKMNMGWQAKMATMLLPTVIYGAMFLGTKFPRTERVTSGVSTGGMFKACLSPLFILLVGCMLLSAATELGTNQWITNILTKTLSPQGGDATTGIMILVWISGIMALGRQFAGPIVHRISPVTMLLFSAVFSAIGLFWLSFADNTVTAFGAATVFSIGICYFWPTMIGLTSEKLPRTGALGMAIMGGAGMLSVALILPVMGKVYDQEGGAMALRYVSALPVVLIVVFGVMAGVYAMKGGYKAEKI